MDPNEPQPEDPRVDLQLALDHLRSAHGRIRASTLAAREVEEAIDHAELAISDLSDGGTEEDGDEPPPSNGTEPDDFEPDPEDEDDNPFWDHGTTYRPKDCPCGAPSVTEDSMGTRLCAFCYDDLPLAEDEPALAVVDGDPYDDPAGMARRPAAAAALAAVRNFLDNKLGRKDYPLRLSPDGTGDAGTNKCGWAFWVLPDDPTSYVGEDLGIEWYGTGWPKDDEPPPEVFVPCPPDPAPNRVTGRESAIQEAWDRQAELLDGADLPDLDTDGGGL